MARERFTTIDVWIVLLLCLVLLGHCSFPNAPEWYVQEVHSWIYSFHMASFYFVCGFLVAHSYRPITSIKSYFSYIVRKIFKFGIPFLGFGFTLCAYHAFVADGGGFSAFKIDVRELFLNPISSPSGYLWFIYLLLEFYFIAPVFCQFHSWIILPGLLISILLHLSPLPSTFCLQLFSVYLLFFLLGIAARRHLTTLIALSKMTKRGGGRHVLPVCLIALWLGTIFLFSEKYPVIPALFSLPSLYVIAHELSKNQKLAIFCEFLSRRCFAIYLWQMICIQLWALLLFNICHLPHLSLLVTVIPMGIAASLTIDWLCHAAIRKLCILSSKF